MQRPDYQMRITALCLFGFAIVGSAENMFVYDPATSVTAAKLGNPLLYDASLVNSDGNTCLTWLEFQPGKGDVIWFGRRDEKGNWTEKQQITPQPGDYANPTLTRDAQTNLWLTYEAATGGNWNIHAFQRTHDAKTFSPFGNASGLVTTGTAANIHHSVSASPKHGVWMTWQADNRGQFDIFARSVGNEDQATPFQVSASPLGDWHPSITVTPANTVVVVWDSYNGTSYNIQSRQMIAGQWGPITALTSSTNFNANAQVVSDKQGRVWVSWEEDGPNWGKAYRPRTDARKDSHKMSDDVGSLHRFRKLHVAELISREEKMRAIELPQISFADAIARTNAPAGVKQLGVFYQSPQLAVDGMDRLWIVYRHFYMPLMGITGKTHVQDDWGIYARCLANDTWSKLYRFNEGQGDALQRISVASETSGISVAWTFGRTDRRHPQNWVEDRLAPEKVVHDIAKKGAVAADEDEEGAPKSKKKKKPQAEVAVSKAPMDNDQMSRGIAFAEIALLEKLTGQPAKVQTISIYRGDETKARIASKVPRPVFDSNGKHYELFFGDFHRHTDISLCFWPGDGTMDDAYRYGIDAAPLDFLGVTDHTHDIAQGDPLSLLWQRIRKEVNRHALTNSFVPFYSYERSRGETDHNVISLRDDMLRPHTYPHSEFWKELDTNTFTIPHQPFNSVLWNKNDREHRPLMEIFQGFRNHTCESDAKEGLDSGNEVGFIASSDHLSTGASFACVWAEKPTRESIFRALQARRTFAATAHIMLRVTCGNHWMGEKFTVQQPPQLNVSATGTASITSMELFVDGLVKSTFQPGKRELQNFTITADKTLTGPHSFYVRLNQADGNQAWSSPMWINIQP